MVKLNGNLRFVSKGKSESGARKTKRQKRRRKKAFAVATPVTLGALVIIILFD